MSNIKNVLLHLTNEEHTHLTQLKEKLELSWEGFMLYLFHSHNNTEQEDTKTNKYGEKYYGK